VLVPLAWLRDFVELPQAANVAEMLAALGFPVERIDRRPAITGVLAGKIVRLHKHPDADRLLVADVDAGNGSLTIVTAATNVEVGQIVPVATIGAQLPALTIVRRAMRGITSEGMMISPEELALPAEWFEDGIMQLDGSVQLGEDVVERFGISEAVLDVEISSNRPDAMSMLGLARELGAFTGAPLRLPEFFSGESIAREAEGASAFIDSSDCLRFVVQRFSHIVVRPSPALMRVRLALAGQRPINNVVDVSNYVMLEIGQPLHFYDAAKVAGGALIVRDARDGESIVTLDGVERALTERALVIADSQRPLGLAGLLGGAAAEVSTATNTILLESAAFAGSRVRRMSAELGLRTEAGSRHERSPAPWFSDAGAQRAAALLVKEGAMAHEARAFGAPPAAPEPIELHIDEVTRLLGFTIEAQECVEYLDRLGFKTQTQGSRTLRTIPPPWRRDITASVDVVEELARIAGYDRVEAAMPEVRPHDIPSLDYHLQTRACAALSALGYREIVSYALHGSQVFERFSSAGIEIANEAVEVRNPLSEDQRYLRQELAPGLIAYLSHFNEPMRIFELGHIFRKGTGGPVESTALAFAFTAARREGSEWGDESFLRLKGDATALLRALTGRSTLETVAAQARGLHPGKAAFLQLGGAKVARVGAIDPRLAAAFELGLPAYLCEIFLDALPPYAPPRYQAKPKYPSTYRDVALICPADLTAAQIEEAMRRALGRLCAQAFAFDEYRGSQVPQGCKSITIRVVLQCEDATITDSEADAAMEAALRELSSRFDVALRT